jgi:hypothetical protein
MSVKWEDTLHMPMLGQLAELGAWQVHRMRCWIVLSVVDQSGCSMAV